MQEASEQRESRVFVSVSQARANDLLEFLVGDGPYAVSCIEEIEEPLGQIEGNVLKILIDIWVLTIRTPFTPFSCHDSTQSI